MRFGRDHLVWKALVALDEAVVASAHGAVERTWALRFALAYLHAVGGGDRRDFDEFWRTLGSDQDWAHSADQADYGRFTYARTYLCAIARSVGHNPAGDLFERLAEARGPIAKRLARAHADAVRSAYEEHVEADRRKREARECRLSD